MKAGTKLFYSFLNTRTQFSHLGLNQSLWIRAFLPVVRVWSESSPSAQSESILFWINSKLEGGSGGAGPHRWPGCQSQALKGSSTVFFIQPWPNLSPLLQRSQRRRTSEPDPAPKKHPETRAHRAHLLRFVYPPSLVSMTPAGLGCFGSHNSWQVVSCVAGPRSQQGWAEAVRRRGRAHARPYLGFRRIPLGGQPRPQFGSSSARWRFQARSTVTKLAGPALIGGCELRQ